MNNQGQLNWKDNSIDLIKMVAAYCVALVHWTKVGVQENPETLVLIFRQIFLAVPSVVVFFVICGYLAAVSVEKYCIKDYIFNRFTRIYPPLWISVAVNILILFLIWRENIDNSFFFGVLAELMGIAYTPSCIKEIPTGSMSGALWTVMVQVQFYFFICIVYPVLKRFKVKQWIYIFVVALSLNVGFGLFSIDTTLAKIVERTIFPYLIWFLFGFFAFLYRDYVVPICKKVCIPCVLLMLGYIAIGRPFAQIGYYADIVITILALPMTIGMAYLPGKIRIRNEYSFSLFLYHWIILNFYSVVGMFQTMGVVEGLIVYLIMVTCISFIMDKVTRIIVKKIFS